MTRVDAARTLRGAVAGAAAASVWAAQQPLDERVFRTGYDDVELLGKFATRGRAWPVAGFAMHVANAAIFGAVYAQLAPSLPVPPALRGPLCGLVEHVGLWPAGRLVDRFHPARDELPQLTGNGRAWLQAAWRHALFGAMLGELERRLNPPAEPQPPAYEVTLSSNGRGSLEDAVLAS